MKYSFSCRRAEKDTKTSRGASEQSGPAPPGTNLFHSIGAPIMNTRHTIAAASMLLAVLSAPAVPADDAVREWDEIAVIGQRADVQAFGILVILHEGSRGILRCDELHVHSQSSAVWVDGS